MFRILAVQFRRVGGLKAVVGHRDPVYTSKSVIMIPNWVTTADECVHTEDAMQRDWSVGKICSDCYRLLEKIGY